MNTKRTAKAALATFGLSVMLPTAALAATDTQGHWAGSVLAKWESQALISGYEDGTIRPDQQISRAEFVALVNRVAGYQATGSTVKFKDVSSSDWYASQVAAAVSQGYIGGFEDNTFRPNASVTRGQAAAVLARIKNLPADAARAGQFADAASIPDWAKGVVGAAANAGYMVGDEANRFNAEKALTRAEAVASLDRVFGVKELAAQTLTLSATEGVFNKYASRTITATSSVEGAAITAVSSDTDVATVTVDGNKVTIKGVDKGSATITVTAKADGYKVATATYKADITAAVGGGGGGSSSGGGGGTTEEKPIVVDKEIDAAVKDEVKEAAKSEVTSTLETELNSSGLTGEQAQAVREAVASSDEITKAVETVAEGLAVKAEAVSNKAPTTTITLPKEEVVLETEDAIITTTIETVVKKVEVPSDIKISVAGATGDPVAVNVINPIEKTIDPDKNAGTLITVEDIKASCDEASQTALANKLGFDSLDKYNRPNEPLVNYTKVEKADGTFDIAWDFGKAKISAADQKTLIDNLNLTFSVKATTKVTPKTTPDNNN